MAGVDLPLIADAHRWLSICFHLGRSSISILGLIVIGSAAPDQKFPAYPVVELYAVSVLSAVALEAQ
jgi:hypothetical protein